MIFVISGTQKFQFNRLFKKIDELVAAKEIREYVFAQIGYSTHIPKNYEYERFLSADKFDNSIDRADIIVSHAGGGAISASLIRGKRICVVPRLAEYGEHVDNHQLEIAEEYEKRNFLEACYGIEHLGQAISNARAKKFAEFASGKRKIADIIDEYVEGAI